MMQYRIRSPRRALAAVVALGVWLAGCSPLTRLSYAPSPEQAATAVRQGRHPEAAAAYEQLAAANDASRQVYLLRATREWLAAGRVPEATRVLASVDAQLPANLRLEHELLEVEVGLGNNNVQQAWAELNALTTAATASDPVRYLDLRRRVALANFRPVDAVRAESSAESYLTNAGERRELRQKFLNELRAAHAAGQRFDVPATQDSLVRGWLELGSLANGGNGASLAAASAAAGWRSRYPNHPAQELVAEALPGLGTAPPITGGIALLLPLSGPAASAGATVRDGFKAAYAMLGTNRGELHVYDTAGGAPAALQQARNDGNGLIVGPLTKTEVAALADLGGSNVPILALNTLPAGRSAPIGLYQFALAPEDEARAVARHLLALGQKRGIALVPSGDWGDRVYAAFTQELLNGGGTVLAESTYDPSSHDFGNEIKAALRTDESETRHKRLETLLGLKMNFEPRRRADLDFIFAPADSSQLARLVRPQLRFYYAGEVPTYMTSDAYDPDADTANQDLDGIYFPDMPWMLGGDGSVDALRAQIGQDWEGRAAWHSRLFAFGFDACQLALSLPGAQRNPQSLQIAGVTGKLSLDNDGRVHRELGWAQIKSGMPRRLDLDGT